MQNRTSNFREIQIFSGTRSLPAVCSNTRRRFRYPLERLPRNRNRCRLIAAELSLTASNAKIHRGNRPIIAEARGTNPGK
jgi:hypothetical protein